MSKALIESRVLLLDGFLLFNCCSVSIGVGRILSRKFQSLGIDTCAHLQKLSLDRLLREFGPKSGTKVFLNNFSIQWSNNPAQIRKYLSSIYIKHFVREKKSATEKKKEQQKLFIDEIEHQTS
jgi:nucleotidyltransferase/DNA polymerase involved in DNA repair